jgi:hypothetical protein
MKRLAGNLSAGLRGKKDHRAGEIFRDLNPTKGNVFLELKEERAVVGVHWGVHGTGSDGVHTNVLRGHILGGCSRQRMERGFR